MESENHEKSKTFWEKATPEQLQKAVEYLLEYGNPGIGITELAIKED